VQELPADASAVLIEDDEDMGPSLIAASIE
jgi:hypothetical protein